MCKTMPVYLTLSPVHGIHKRLLAHSHLSQPSGFNSGGLIFKEAQSKNKVLNKNPLIPESDDSKHFPNSSKFAMVKLN